MKNKDCQGNHSNEMMRIKDRETRMAKKKISNKMAIK